MSLNPEIIAAISSAVVAVIGAFAAFLKRKRIAQYFTNRKSMKLERKKSKLEAKQAKLAQKNYNKFLKMKNVSPALALEALKNTNRTFVEISKTIDHFDGLWIDDDKSDDKNKDR